MSLISSEAPTCPRRLFQRFQQRCGGLGRPPRRISAHVARERFHVGHGVPLAAPPSRPWIALRRSLAIPVSTCRPSLFFRWCACPSCRWPLFISPCRTSLPLPVSANAVLSTSYSPQLCCPLDRMKAYFPVTTKDAGSNAFHAAPGPGSHAPRTRHSRRGLSSACSPVCAGDLNPVRDVFVVTGIGEGGAAMRRNSSRIPAPANCATCQSAFAPPRSRNRSEDAGRTRGDGRRVAPLSPDRNETACITDTPDDASLPDSRTRHRHAWA